MNRGEVWWVQFDPAIGGEIRKERPAVIVSNDESNRRLNRLQVVPVTSRVDRIYSSEASVTVAGRPGKAMAHQLTTVSKLRVREQVGRLTQAEMARVDRAMAVQLGMSH